MIQVPHFWNHLLFITCYCLLLFLPERLGKIVQMFAAGVS